MTDLQARLQAALGDTYRIERELGGGGMSRVFLAHEAALGRRVVVKVLPPEMAAGVNAERFRREIQLAARARGSEPARCRARVPYSATLEGRRFRNPLPACNPKPRRSSQATVPLLCR